MAGCARFSEASAAARQRASLDSSPGIVRSTTFSRWPATSRRSLIFTTLPSSSVAMISSTGNSSRPASADPPSSPSTSTSPSACYPARPGNDATLPQTGSGVAHPGLPGHALVAGMGVASSVVPSGAMPTARVCYAEGESARDEDGDGYCKLHVNTMEGFFTSMPPAGWGRVPPVGTIKSGEGKRNADSLGEDLRLSTPANRGETSWGGGSSRFPPQWLCHEEPAREPEANQSVLTVVPRLHDHGSRRRLGPRSRPPEGWHRPMNVPPDAASPSSSPRRHRHHRRTHRPAPARRPGRTGGRPADAMHQQPQAARHRPPQL